MNVFVHNIKSANGLGYEINQVTGDMPKDAVRVPVEKVDMSLQKWVEDWMRTLYGKVSW